MLKPDAGAIFFQGEKLHGDFVKKGIVAGGKFSMVFQEGALLDEITVWENIGITLLENGPVPASQVFSLAEKVALQTGLQKDDLQKYVWQLSGGMRKKVAIARAVFHQPQLILYDEPTAGLDPASADMIDQLIRDIRQRTGAAALVVTHDLHSIRALADQVVLLDSGKIVFEGDPATFLSSQNPVLVKFTGTRNL